MAEQNEKQELKVVTNWKDLNVDGIELQQDLTEDAWEFGAPPPRGVYELKCFLAKDGITYGLEDPKDPKSVFFNIAIEAKTVSENEEYNNIPVFARVNTRMYRGKNISTAAGFLVKAGFKVENPITPKKLAMMMQAALKKEPVVKAELDWRGSYKYTDNKGNDKYENVYNHYEEFPDNMEKPGTKKHLVTVANKHTGGSVEVRAMLQVVKFFGKGDTIPVFSSGSKLVSAPKSLQPQPVLQQATPVATSTAPQLQFATPPQVETGGQSEDEDLALLLQE